jgi:trans-aconitate methyltransferase
MALFLSAINTQGRFVVEFGGKGNVQQLVHALETASLRVLGQAVPHPWYFPSVGEFASLLERTDLEVVQAALFDRPTVLEGDEGLRNWVKMFGNHWLNQIPVERRAMFFEQLEEAAHPQLFRDGKWYADYRRLRVVAVRRSS